MTAWVDLEWLKEQTGIKSLVTLKKRILIPHRKELDKFVYYPSKRGEHWKFSREHMEVWLKNNMY